MHAHGPVASIRIAFFLNLVFTIIEIVGGILTNSIAVVADAIHDLGDTIALGFALVLEKLARKKRDPNFSYGYKRFSLLAAMINGIVLIGGSGFVLFYAVPRLLEPQASNSLGMMGLAAAGIVFNGLGVLRLRKGETMNEKMLTWHLLEDVLGWVAVLITAVIMYFWHVPILDPILAIAFTAVTLWNVLRLVKQTMMIFLQSVPGNVNVAGIDDRVRKLDGVHSVHDTHVWSMDGEYHVLTTHVVIKDSTPDGDIIPIKQKVREIMNDSKVKHATIEIEREDEPCHLVDC